MAVTELSDGAGRARAPFVHSRDKRYVGLDVHESTISAAVRNAEGKLVMESVIATKATAIVDWLQGLRGRVEVTFEEGTHSAWLYDVVVQRVARVVVCNPRQNALLKAGSKNDRIDARKLSELLRGDLLSPWASRPGLLTARRFSERRWVGRTRSLAGKERLPSLRKSEPPPQHLGRDQAL